MTIVFPRPLYFLIVAAGTQLFLSIAAALVLLSAGLLTEFPWRMLGMLLTYNVMVATLTGSLVSGRTLPNSTAAIRGVGLILGHFIGLVLGGFLGWRYGGLIGAIAGAVVLYFTVGWVGSRTSLLASIELSQRNSSSWETSTEKLLRFSQRRHRAWYVYGATVPGLVLLIAPLLRTSGWPSGELGNLLPAARFVSVALSGISIAAPWVLRSRNNNRRSAGYARDAAIAAGGVAFSLAPAIYGLLVYMVFGLSLNELLLFALTASLAAATWGARVASS